MTLALGSWSITVARAEQPDLRWRAVLMTPWHLVVLRGVRQLARRGMDGRIMRWATRYSDGVGDVPPRPVRRYVRYCLRWRRVELDAERLVSGPRLRRPILPTAQEWAATAPPEGDTE